MWICPKCQREFDKNNQEHFCGENSKDIDEYISAQKEAVIPLLNQVRKTLREALPMAEERISWGMPTYWHQQNIIHFAACKNHIGLYPGSEAVEFFAGRLTEFKTSKGAIQFPYNKPLPLSLIKEIGRWCDKTGVHS